MSEDVNGHLPATELLWMPSQRGGRYRPEEQLIAASAHGYSVRDTNGVEYLDLNSGLWHVSFGYSHPVVVGAAQRALTELAATSLFRRLHEPALDLAVRLAEELPDTRFFLGCTGSDAIDSAIRIASAYGRAKGENRDVFASVVGGYHGATRAAMSVMGIAEYRPSTSDAEDHLLLPAPTRPDWAGQLEEIFDRRGQSMAAVFVEVVQGSGGVVPLPADYLDALRRLCDRHDVLLVMDEVATGVHRTGPFLAGDDVGVRGDLTILGKAITGGFAPLSVVAVQCRVFNVVTRSPDPVRLAGFTQGGHPVACAIAAAILDHVRTDEFRETSAAGRAALASGIEPLRSTPPPMR